jgi:hypothetical protein
MQLFMTSPASPKTTTGQSRPMSRPLGSAREIRMGNTMGNSMGSKGNTADHPSPAQTHSPSSYLQKARQALSKDAKPKNTDSTQTTQNAQKATDVAQKAPPKAEKTAVPKQTSELNLTAEIQTEPSTEVISTTARTSTAERTTTATRTKDTKRTNYLSRFEGRDLSHDAFAAPQKIKPAQNAQQLPTHSLNLSLDTLWVEVTHSLRLCIQAIQKTLRHAVHLSAHLCRVVFGLASHGLSALGRSVVLGIHAGWKFILRGAIHFQKRVHELLQLLGKTFWNPAPPTAMSTQEALERLL